MTNMQIGGIGLVALVLGVMAATGMNSSIVLSLLTQATIFAIFALGVGFLLRQNGMVSFGHALFFGGAGYAVGILQQLKLMTAEAAIFATLLGTAITAILIGLVIVRVSGMAFAMLTLAVGQMFYLTALSSRGLTGGADGLNIDWGSTLFGVPISLLLKPANLFLLSWVTLVVAVMLLAILVRSRFGSITEAVRDNEERARFIGVSTLLPRAVVYAVSATVTSLAGLLSALNTGFVSPESLHWSLSAIALLMVIVGGYKALWGPPLGAMAYFLIKDFLGEYANHWMAIFGAALIAVIVFSPTGIAGALERLVKNIAASRAANSTAEH